MKIFPRNFTNQQFHAVRRAWHSNVVRKTIVILILLLIRLFLFLPFPTFFSFSWGAKTTSPKWCDGGKRKEIQPSIESYRCVVSISYSMYSSIRIWFRFDSMLWLLEGENGDDKDRDWRMKRRGRKIEWKRARRVKPAGDAWFNDTWCEVIIYDGWEMMPLFNEIAIDTEERRIVLIRVALFNGIVRSYWEPSSSASRVNRISALRLVHTAYRRYIYMMWYT